MESVKELPMPDLALEQKDPEIFQLIEKEKAR
jgi:hypothetical protein